MIDFTKLDRTSANDGFHKMLEIWPHIFSTDRARDVLGDLDLAAQERLPHHPLNLNDSNDVCNVRYRSQRSNLHYCYLKTNWAKSFNAYIVGQLSQRTGFDWSGGINAHCLPLFDYGFGGAIKAHRGRDIGYGANDLVAVAMLTEPGRDFTGGQFFINEEAEVSEDGKVVVDDEATRTHIDIPFGALLLFDNRRLIHGTTPVKPGTDGCRRVTASWRLTC